MCQVDWPEGTVDLLNSASCVSGYWVNASDTFCFKGSVEELNRILLRTSQISGTPLTLCLIRDVLPPSPFTATPHDWAITFTKDGWGRNDDDRECESGYRVLLRVGVTDAIPLESLRVPASALCLAMSDDKELERFATWHNADVAFLVKAFIAGAIILLSSAGVILVARRNREEVEATKR